MLPCYATAIVAELRLICQYYAMAIAAMGMVASLRKSSVIFAALIGSLLFYEPFGRQRILAAIIVRAGVLHITFLG